MQEKKEWETPKLGKLDLKNTAVGIGPGGDAAMGDIVVVGADVGGSSNS